MATNENLSELQCNPEQENWSAIENSLIKHSQNLYNLSITPPEICWSNISSKINPDLKIDEAYNSQNKMKTTRMLSNWMRYAAVITGIVVLSLGMLNTSFRNGVVSIFTKTNLKTSLTDSQYKLLKVKEDKVNVDTLNSKGLKTIEETSVK